MTAAQNVLTQQAVLVALLDGELEPLDGQRVFGAAVDVTLVRAHGVAGDGHAFDDAVRIALQDAAVHECSGVAFVGVADGVLDATWGLATQLPFQAGEEASATAAAQAGALGLLNHLIRRHLCERLAQRGIALARDVLVNAFGIDQAAVA